MQCGNSHIQEKFIVELLRQGCEHAFNSLFRAYSKRLYRFSIGYLRSGEEAKEIVQETFTKIWEIRSTIDPECSFSSFVFTIAHRLILNRFRKIKYDLAAQAVLKRHIRQVNNETEEAIMAADLDRRAQLAIAGLPPKRKAIFHMVRDSNMSYQQVADKLHISVKTVEAQMTEALRYLRKKIIIQAVLPAIMSLFF
jgi:RNA polymerase sigma-70 factor (ECF subfamily)